MVNDVELLAPAGSFEALVAAIQNGADAVYIGGSRFSARAFAANFDDQGIVEAIEYAHLHFAKLYVAINTVYYDDEIDELLRYVEFLYEANCDAVIIQDIGLFSIIKNKVPGMEIHISTQMSLNNLESVRFFEQHDADRVVLARENSIAEIAYIAQNTNVDLEVFVHGAICVSYSGQCLMSSNIAKRSGNRGSCGQPCRLEYELLKDNRMISRNSYLLSPKDLCTIENIGELIDANVRSFKIEGRMKRPEYVAVIVKAYRKAIDNHLKKKTEDLSLEIEAMKKMFNRGFSKGYLFNDPDKMALDFPGHQGVEIGKVVGYDNRFKRVAIALNDILNQNDRILFKDDSLKRTVTKLYLNGLLVNQAGAGDIVEIEMDSRIQPNTTVNRIYDVKLIDEANKSYKKEAVKKGLRFKFHAFVGKCPVLEYDFKGIKGKIVGADPVENAIKRSISEEDVIKQLSKLNDTTFYPEDISVEMDWSCYFPLKVLNQLRREAVENIKETLLEKRAPVKIDMPPLAQRNHQIRDVVVKVADFAQLRAALKFTRNICYPVDKTTIKAFDYLAGKEVNLSLATTYRYELETVDLIKGHPYYQNVENVFVGDYRGLSLFADKKTVVDANFNLVNSHSASFFEGHPVNLSSEMSLRQINNIKTVNDLYFQVYGRAVNMVTRHCVISQHHFGRKVEGCNKCAEGNYALKDRLNEVFPIRTNDLCDNIIYHNKPTMINDIKNLNVDQILLSFTDENESEIEQIVTYYLNLLNNGTKTDFDFRKYVKLYYND